MMYRGSEMEFHHNITKEGIRILCDHLKVRTDLDLRGEAVGKIERSALGDGVALRLIPALHMQIFSKRIRKIPPAAFFLFLPKAIIIPFMSIAGVGQTGRVQ